MFFAESQWHPRHNDLLWPLWAYFDLTPEGRGDWFPPCAFFRQIPLPRKGRGLFPAQENSPDRRFRFSVGADELILLFDMWRQLSRLMYFGRARMHSAIISVTATIAHPLT